MLQAMAALRKTITNFASTNNYKDVHAVLNWLVPAVKSTVNDMQKAIALHPAWWEAEMSALSAAAVVAANEEIDSDSKAQRDQQPEQLREQQPEPQRQREQHREQHREQQREQQPEEPTSLLRSNSSAWRDQQLDAAPHSSGAERNELRSSTALAKKRANSNGSSSNESPDQRRTIKNNARHCADPPAHARATRSTDQPKKLRLSSAEKATSRLRSTA